MSFTSKLGSLASRAYGWSAAVARAVDQYFEYVTLLLPGNGTNGAQNNTFLDGSTNNFTITRNGNTTQGTFSPFSQTGWGNYFSGSSQYLSVANNAALNLSSGNFTIEAFVYYNGTNNSATIINKDGVSGSTYQSYGLKLNGSGYVTLDVGSGNSASYFQQVVSGTALPTNTWTHVAAVKSGTTLSLYQNGVRVASATQTGTIVDGGKSVLIGYETGQISAYYWNGYISNLRVVKGVAVYSGTSTTTANFDVPTSPLTATQSAATNIQAITGTQTSLLTCQSNRFIDNSTNNFTITRNGSPSVVAFSPFNPTSSWSAATYGGSGYFDGSGDYLTLPSNSALSLSGDFTIEFFVYLTTAATQQTIWTAPTGASDRAISALTGTNFAYYDGTADRVFGPVVASAWTHIVLSRVGNTVKGFYNGTEGFSVTDTATLEFSSGTLGYRTRTPAGQALNGYLSSFRIVKGSGVTSVTVPTAPLTAITNASLLLNFTNAGIYDATSKNDLETVGNAQISTAISAKWGSGSMYFNGTGNYLAIYAEPTKQNLNFGTGDFTIETWIYFTTVSGAQGIIDNATSPTSGTTGQWYWFKTSSNTLQFGQGGVGNILTTTGTVSATTWTHIAITRSGSTLRAFINGNLDSSVSNSTNFNNGNGVQVGLVAASTYLNAYLQDLRITKGYARYVTGTGGNAGKMVFNGTNDLALPTAAFPTL